MTTDHDFARMKRAMRMATAASLALALAACQEAGGIDNARAYHPIPSSTLDLMASKGTGKNAPVLIRTFKKEAEFEVWKMRPDGRYAYIKTFPMCRWSGQLGPKTREGDRQVPEGFYAIAPGQMNPQSHYYLSFNVGYPNAYDRAHGDTGGEIMVHGVCSSAGCFSMTDQQIDEIYAIAREAFAGGQREIQMQSYPFHMTAQNLAKFRLDPNMPFWRELKKGSDYFDVTGQEPEVGVCAKRYVFGVPAGVRLDPTGPCPAVKADPAVEAALEQKGKQDDAQVAALIQQGVKPVRLVYQDGGQNVEFVNKRADASRPDALASGPIEIALDEKATPAILRAAAAGAKGKASLAKSARIELAKAAPTEAAKPARIAAAKPGRIELAKAAKPALLRNKPPEMIAASGPMVASAAPRASSGGASFYQRWMGVVTDRFSSPAPKPAATQSADLQIGFAPLPPLK